MLNRVTTVLENLGVRESGKSGTHQRKVGVHNYNRATYTPDSIVKGAIKEKKSLLKI